MVENEIAEEVHCNVICYTRLIGLTVNSTGIEIPFHHLCGLLNAITVALTKGEIDQQNVSLRSLYLTSFADFGALVLLAPSLKA